MQPINWDAVDEQVAQGWIKKRKHPDADLYIYNYSQKTQHSWYWTPETKVCRGLITDGERNIVARPFPKFFSYEQLEGKLPEGPYRVYEKVDGWLGIMYWANGQPAIATRGSFETEAAKWATEYFRNAVKVTGWRPPEQFTLLFEIVHPMTRIVVDYQGAEMLVLIGIVETETGREIPLGQVFTPFSTAKLYPGWELENVLADDDPKREGFVLHYDSGEKVKIKFAEYKRLHKLLTSLTARDVWQWLSEGKHISDMVEGLPEDAQTWALDVAAELEDQYMEITKSCRWTRELAWLQRFKTRAEVAEYVKRYSNPHITFAMIDGKDYSKAVWKLLYPPHRPFRTTGED